MSLHLFYVDYEDSGSRENWSVFYVHPEIYTDESLADKREAWLKTNLPDDVDYHRIKIDDGDVNPAIDNDDGDWADDEDWDDVIETNLTSVFNITKVFVKPMVKARTGRVINISSVAGLMGNPGQVNYSASKAGIGGFTRSLAKELASRNITVNCISPGFIASDMTKGFEGEAQTKVINQIPAQKLGDPKNIADLAIFLASKKASYITGQTISVDGGLYMS